MIEWLLTPVDPERVHEVGSLVAWHGRGMVLAWGIILPLGVIAARFYKVMPGQDWPREIENPVWWLLHRVLQYGGLGIMVLALVAILLSDVSMPGAALHVWMGWSMFALAAIQFVAALMHGTKGGPRDRGPDGSMFGDHYNMTRHRIVFEWVHKNLGYLLLGMSVVSIISGLWISNALRWMWVVQIIWWIVIVWWFAALQRRGRAIDTYQAIWGTHPEHPGNRTKPVGWGITRGEPDPGIDNESIRDRLTAKQAKTWWETLILR